MKLGINGLGRIGKLSLWTHVSRKHFSEIVVNIGRDVGSNLDDLTAAIERDSTYGRLGAYLHGHRTGRVIEELNEETGQMRIDGVPVRILRRDRNPQDIPWRENGVKLIVDTTGVFKDPTADAGEAKGALRGHLQAGAAKVILSAPFKIKAKGLDMPGDAITMVMGINDDDYQAAGHNIISAASCTTTCLSYMVKPLIEVIAGIPTVVFGLFALVTVGPFLRDFIAVPTGLGNSGSSVMTAGLVIGILNTPFISSLADDIINAVPNSMREGSYGLGATKSETIRQVVLPAALPGIVGAVLLAASRAIGETMIVVMGAGAAAKLGLNPFEAMTTITVKIVSQLTGDLAFDSPETLVAFALGITLFVLTLGLNIFALWFVRKYREQYD